MPFNVKEENIALGLKYTVSALSHANLRACTHFITRPFRILLRRTSERYIHTYIHIIIYQAFLLYSIESFSRSKRIRKIIANYFIHISLLSSPFTLFTLVFASSSSHFSTHFPRHFRIQKFRRNRDRKRDKKRRGHDTTEVTFPLPLSRSLLTSSQKSRKSTYIIVRRLFVETLARSPIIAIIAIFTIYYEKIFSQSCWFIVVPVATKYLNIGPISRTDHAPPLSPVSPYE